jgi:transcription antitermination factor NusG
MSGVSWFVIQSKRHRERLVHAVLSQEGVPAYLPLLRHWPAPAVGAAVGPMFPGYVFCRPAPEQVYRVASCHGSRGFVNFGNGPAVLDEAVIAYLRARTSPDGVIDVDPAVEGREVTIVEGPLRGLAAVVERRLPARDRILVLLELLQRPTRVELPDRWVRVN